MITKAQSKQLQKQATVAVRPKLSAQERAMLTWVVLDPGDKVLDANTTDGLMLEYISRNMECDICGMASHMEDVRQARARLQQADVVYGHLGDIPWRENAFDALFLRKERQEEDSWRQVLQETMRVLKPGGQFLLGTTCYPAPLRQLMNYVTSNPDNVLADAYQGRQEMEQALEAVGYQQVSWHQLDLFSGVLIGWKPMEGQGEEP